jgi:hypothetical protein
VETHRKTHLNHATGGLTRVKGGVVKIHWGVILGSGTLGTEVLELYYNNLIMKLLLFSFLSDL